MAGIGIKLNRIFSKRTITTDLYGFGYSTVVTIAPMILVIAAVLLMQLLLGGSQITYADRELYSCTILYIFIFALLSASPFNAVLSKYISDIIYLEQYDNIRACYYVGLVLNVALGTLMGIPFCIREWAVGKVEVMYVFAGYCGFVTLIFVFYSMLYLSICKVYKLISLFFFLGMTITVVLSVILRYVFHVAAMFAMLVSLDVGFLLVGALEYALIRSYFKENSRNYKDVLSYFKKYWQLVGTNFLYTLGLYMHNFVFWTTRDRMIVADSFVCTPPYDMATCLAMFTNISASVIFIARVEMNFHERYKRYSEAVIGGRGMDIRNAKTRMFEQLAAELLNLVRIQFIVSVAIFFLCMLLLPRFGFGGKVMMMYPCLAVGYFILFVMYAIIIFLYYFNDLNGALMTSLAFAVVTLLASLFASRLSIIWYGIGLTIGAGVGFIAAYLRLRYIEKNLDVHVFCKGTLMKSAAGDKPSSKVFERGMINGKDELRL